ncbi:hypothetical protein [Lignipirellula cremea]|uniref:Cytochrome c domain-containing protein n=1 Tax=Lignipirellula cremea TaxID=2528010 RepID=A0A518DRN2_9BACT|nr:hypothetical protein [Lignipirellula cremea]QDU94491.1 hypothetical protein Pla8534_22820 [Lignipirellula cremea]
MTFLCKFFWFAGVLTPSAVLLFVLTTACAQGEPPAEKQPDAFPNFQVFERLQRAGPLGLLAGPSRVPAGSEDEAHRYYQQIGKELGFANEEPPASLDQLIAYLGYAGLTTSDLLRLEPQVLINLEQLPAKVASPERFRKHFVDRPLNTDEILSVRFFAPKTTDVSGKVEPRKLSWRWLVRLKARPDSPAERNGVALCFLMSNSYVPLSAKSPFEKAGLVNQVILVRRAGADLPSPLYWMLFDSIDNGGKLAASALTSWDAADPDLPRHDPLKKYYVPGACVHCHGGAEKNGMLSYLDTDHWIDRTRLGDDFEDLGRSPFHPIYDSGGDSKTKQYATTFDVLRKLNVEIQQQNHRVNPTSFITQAADTWVRLHQQSPESAPTLDRGIPGKDDVTWNKANATDRELLPLLNRYCYRCHSSLAYHVFDKQAVLERVDDMVYRLEEEDFSLRMPQDRNLPESVTKRLIQLLTALQNENP